MASASRELPWTWPSGVDDASPSCILLGLLRSRITWLRPWKGAGLDAPRSQERLLADAWPGMCGALSTMELRGSGEPSGVSRAAPCC
eukprot:3493713-Alexandrium_andersonii.AAC.1